MTGDPLTFDLYHPQPLLLIISGPSAVGKDAVLNGLKAHNLPIYFVVTATTRKRRETEREGVDYFFVSLEKFKELIDKDELLEYATVYRDFKGVPKWQIRQALRSGKDVVLRLDVQGAGKIKTLYPEAVLIFLLPENEEIWLRHFKKRNTETDEDLKLRIKTARLELACIDLFDYMVVNPEGKLDETVDTIEAIIHAEHHLVQHKKVSL